MAQKIIDIDINGIFYQLHEAALENSKDTEVEIFNTGVDEEAKNYTGSGEYFICASSTDPDSLPDEGLKKDKALEVLKKYLQFFCGEDTAKNINEKMLLPIKEGEKVSRHSNSGDVSEAVTYDYSLLTQLFDCDQLEDDGTFAALSEADDDDDKKVVGYLLPYLAKVNQEKPKPAHIGRKRLLNHFKRLGRWSLVTGLPSLAAMPFSLLGKLAGSLPGIVIKTGSGDFDTKGVTDKIGKGLKAVGNAVKKTGELGAKAYDYVKSNLEIDLSTLESSVSQAFDKDYPSNDVHPRVYKISTLIQILRKQQKFSNKIKNRLESAGEYCLGILVSSDDINYDQYSKETIAIEVTKGIANQNPSMFSNKITKDNVLKVAGYNVKSRSKNKKIFYESEKTANDIGIELTKFLFEGGAIVSDEEAVEFCKKAAKIVERCKTNSKFWDEFENDPTISDADIATKAFPSKFDLRQWFEKQIAAKKNVLNLVKQRFETNKKKAKKFLDLVTTAATKAGVKIPTDPSKPDPKKPQFEAPQTTTDLYIVLHKGMAYPDKDDEPKSRK